MSAHRFSRLFGALALATLVVLTIGAFGFGVGDSNNGFDWSAPFLP